MGPGSVDNVNNNKPIKSNIVRLPDNQRNYWQKMIAETVNIGLDRYAVYGPRFNGEDTLYIQDPSQENMIVSEGQEYWQNIILDAAKLSADKAKKKEFQRIFDSLDNGFNAMLKLAEDNGNEGVFPAFRIKLENGKIVPDASFLAKGLDPLNAAADADNGRMKNWLNARKIFTTNKYDKNIDEYIPHLKKLFKPMGNGYYVMLPSEDWRPSWGSWYFTDYIDPATAIKIAEYLQEKGNKTEAAEWLRIAKGLYKTQIELIKQKNEFPQKAYIEADKRGNLKIDIKEGEHQSFDGIRAPWRLAETVEHLDILDPKRESVPYLKKYLGTWKKYANSDLLVSAQYMYLTLAQAVGDKETFDEILNDIEQQNIKPDSQYFKNDTLNRYYQTTLAMISGMKIMQYEKEIKTFSDIGISSFKKLKAVNEDYWSNFVSELKYYCNNVVDLYDQAKYFTRNILSNFSKSYQDWQAGLSYNDTLDGISYAIPALNDNDSPVLEKNAVTDSVTSLNLATALVMAGTNGDQKAFMTLFNTIKKITPVQYDKNKEFIIRANAVPWAVDINELKPIRVFKKNFAIAKNDKLMNFINKYNQFYGTEKYSYGKDGITVINKIENEAEIKDFLNCFDDERSLKTAKQIVAASIKPYGEKVLDCTASASDADATIIAGLMIGYSKMSAAWSETEKKEVQSWINLMTDSFLEQNILTVSNVKKDNNNNQTVFLIKEGANIYNEEKTLNEVSYLPGHANRKWLKVFKDYYETKTFNVHDAYKYQMFAKIDADAEYMNNLIMKKNKGSLPVKVNLKVNNIDNNNLPINIVFLDKLQDVRNNDINMVWQTDPFDVFDDLQIPEKRKTFFKSLQDSLFQLKNTVIDKNNAQLLAPAVDTQALSYGLMKITDPAALQSKSDKTLFGFFEKTFKEQIIDVNSKEPKYQGYVDLRFKQYLLHLGQDIKKYNEVLESYYGFRKEMYGDKKRTILNELYNIAYSRYLAEGRLNEQSRQIMYKIYADSASNGTPDIKMKVYNFLMVYDKENFSKILDGELPGGNVQNSAKKIIIEQRSELAFKKGLVAKEELAEKYPLLYQKKEEIFINPEEDYLIFKSAKELSKLTKRDQVLYKNVTEAKKLAASNLNSNKHVNQYIEDNVDNYKFLYGDKKEQQANIENMLYSRYIYSKYINERGMITAANKMLELEKPGDVTKALVLYAGRHENIQIQNYLTKLLTDQSFAIAKPTELQKIIVSLQDFKQDKNKNSIWNRQFENKDDPENPYAVWHNKGVFYGDVANMMFLVRNIVKDKQSQIYIASARKNAEEILSFYKKGYSVFSKDGMYWENQLSFKTTCLRIDFEKATNFGQIEKIDKELREMASSTLQYRELLAYANIQAAIFRSYDPDMRGYAEERDSVRERILRDPLVKAVPYIYETLNEKEGD